jgi:hypothetical protein
MKIAFLYPSDGALDPRLEGFYSKAFVGCFSELGAELLLLEVESHSGVIVLETCAAPGDHPQSMQKQSSLLPSPESLYNSVFKRASCAKLRTLLQTFQTDVVQTFGYASHLSPIWSALSVNQYPIVHLATARDPLMRSGSELLAQPWHFEDQVARYMSRRVSAVIGTNRCDVANYRNKGFFRNAQLSSIAGIPVKALPLHANSTSKRGSWPRFGFFSIEYAPAAVSLLLNAVADVGTRRRYTIVLSDQYKSIVEKSNLKNVELTPALNLGEFLESVDIMVFPQADDSIAQVIVGAAVAGKLMIASERGIGGELLDYGRRGILFTNPSDLTGRIQDVVIGWPDGSPLFTSAQEVLSETSPKRCAEIFLNTYKRLVEGRHGRSKSSIAAASAG